MLVWRELNRKTAARGGQVAGGNFGANLGICVGSGGGIGWGLAGFCPGPALSALSLALPKAFVFVAAMLLGMWGYKIMTLKPSQLSKR